VLPHPNVLDSSALNASADKVLNEWGMADSADKQRWVRRESTHGELVNGEGGGTVRVHAGN
jgi:hypothetical protein